MNGDLEISSFDIHDDGQQLNIKVTIRNTSTRTLYVYKGVRGVRYDEASKTLRLLLTDRHVTEGLRLFAVHRPALIPIDPGESEKLTLQVARTITQLGPQQDDRPGPALRQLHAHEAQAVELEVSWGDTPFYPEPGEKRAHKEQLGRWERGPLEARFDRLGKKLG